MDLLSILGLTPDSMQNQIMMQRAGQQQQAPSPVNLTQNGGDNTDWLSQLQAAGADKSPSAASAYQPTSGSEMEADAHSSIDDLMAQLAAQRNQYRQQDSNQQWMSFFSKLASSKNPRLLGGLGEGAEALTETKAKQNANNQLLDQSALQDQIKYRQWQQDQARQQQLADQTGEYQRGELANRNAALDQGKYTMTPDGLGGFIKINNKTGETESIGSPGGAVPTSAVDEKGNPLVGDAYLKTLDPRIAKTAKMVADGDMPWPSGFALKYPYWQNVIAAAQTYDPTTNGNRFPAVKAFNTGKQGDLMRSLDVSTQHLDVLGDLSTALANGDTKLINKAKNSWREQFGEEAPSDFNTAKEIVANEVVKSIVGGQNAVADRAKAQATFDAAKSPEQLAGSVKTVKSLMKGQIDGLKQQYENSTGRKDFYNRLTPKTRNQFGNKDSAATDVPSADAPAPDYSHLWGQ